MAGAWASNDWFFPYDSINSVAQRPIGTPFQDYFSNSPAGFRAAIATGYQGPTVGPFDVSSGSNSASSVLAGLQIGYNYQISNWVLGVEGEASWTNLEGSNVDPNFPTINHTDTDFIGVLGGRLGHASDRLLIYGKAGGAWAHDKHSVYSNGTFTVGNGSPVPVTVTSRTMVDAATVNRFGYMLGAGVEYALTSQWSVKAEYEYLDFGTQRTTLPPATTVVSPYDEDISQRIQFVEIGLNYKFDPAPGVAAAPVHPLFDQVGQSGYTQRFYGGADYLLWWAKDAPLSVPLVTTGPESTTEGIINSNQTTILYGAPFSPAAGGNDAQNFGALSGVRLWLGYWLDDAQRFAIEAGGFWLQKAEADFNISSDSTGSPALSIPEYNTFHYLGEGKCSPSRSNCGTGVGEDRSPVAVPEELAGSITIKNTLEFWGLHANGVMNFIRTPSWDVSALGGFRYLNLKEDFNLYSTLAGISGSSFAGQSGYTDDDFATRNQFYGALLGLRARGMYGPFSLESTLTAALGVSHETISINGMYQAYGFFTTTGPYGIFATPANSGTTSSNEFAVVPEAEIKLGYDITPTISVTIGYDFIYWSNVVRPTDQIDRNLVKGQFYQEDQFSTSLAYPQRLDQTTDFYAQGVSVGLTARF